MWKHIYFFNLMKSYFYFKRQKRQNSQRNQKIVHRHGQRQEFLRINPKYERFHRSSDSDIFKS